MADQRHQDLVHVRRARRRPDAARAHRPRPLARRTAGCRCFLVEKPRGDSARLPLRPGRRARAAPTATGASRGARSTRSGYRGHALLRAELRQLVRARRRPGRRRGRARPRLLLPDGRLRERTHPDRRARRRRDAGGLRGGARVRAQPRRLRRADHRLRAHPRRSSARMAAIIQCARQFALEVARADGSRRRRRSRRRWPRPTSVGPPSGSPARPCRSTAAWATPRSTRSAATSSTRGCCRSSRAPTRRSASR